MPISCAAIPDIALSLPVKTLTLPAIESAEGRKHLTVTREDHHRARLETVFVRVWIWLTSWRSFWSVSIDPLSTIVARCLTQTLSGGQMVGLVAGLFPPLQHPRIGGK
jgi:hypothetical protein